MYLSYCGIRVKDFERSLAFYTDGLGLKELQRGDNRPVGGGLYVLLRDEMSGQRLELNWYPEGSPYGSPYAPGEGLDHLAFKVDDVGVAVANLARWGAREVPIDAKLSEPNPRGSPGWFRVAYVTDPDGNWIELYQHERPAASYNPDRY